MRAPISHMFYDLETLIAQCIGDPAGVAEVMKRVCAVLGYRLHREDLVEHRENHGSLQFLFLACRSSRSQHNELGRSLWRPHRHNLQVYP